MMSKYLLFITLSLGGAYKCCSTAFATPMPHKTEFELKVGETTKIGVKIQAETFEGMNVARELIIERLSRPKECVQQSANQEPTNVVSSAQGFKKSTFKWQWEP